MHAPAFSRDVAPLGREVGATGFARGAPLTLNMLESLFQTFVNAFWRSEITVIEEVKI